MDFFNLNLLFFKLDQFFLRLTVNLSHLLNSVFFWSLFCGIMDNIPIIQTAITIVIRMALNTEPIFQR